MPRWSFGHPQPVRSAVIYPCCSVAGAATSTRGVYLSDVLNRLPSTKIPRSKKLLPASGNLHRRTLLRRALWLLACRRSDDEKTYTDKQGQYLAFIYYYTKSTDFASEADLQHTFESLRLLCSDDLNARSTRPHRANAGKARSIQLLTLVRRYGLG